MNPIGIIFDMDGTITFTESFHHQAFSHVFRQYGIEFTFAEEVKKYAGAGSRKIFTSVFAERGIEVSPQEIEQCIARKKELYKKIVQKADISFVPGVLEFVKKIHEKGIKSIIATGNSDLESVRLILEKVGLKEYFPDMISVTEVARGKPFPDVFLEAARRIRVPPQACVVFEDAINGVLAAKAAKMRCIALETTTKKDDLIEAGADEVVKDYKDIPEDFMN